MTKKGCIKDFRLFYKTKSGDKIPVLFSGSVMRNQDGKIIGIVCTARDMREVIRAEEIVKEKQTQLIHAGRLSSLGEMATGVAHELNQPLGIIGMDVKGLRLSIKNNTFSSELALPILDRTWRHVTRATNIIKNMRMFARPGRRISEPIVLEDTITRGLSFFKVDESTIAFFRTTIPYNCVIV